MKQDRTLVDLISRSVSEYAAEPIFGTKVAGQYQWITYSEFGLQIDSATRALAATGFQTGARAAIISANRVEWAAFAYAAYRLGGVVVPMYESQSPEDWMYIIQDAEPVILAISGEKYYQRLQPCLKDLPSIRHLVMFEGGGGETLAFAEWLRGGAPDVTATPVTPEQLADLIYTSGTTGRPKGVMLSHDNVVSNINAVKELFPLGPGDVSLSFLPWAHAFGQILEMHGLISMGAAIGLAERVDTILENLKEVRPTMLVSVPRIFNRIYEGVHRMLEEEGGMKTRLLKAGLANTARLREKEETQKFAPLNSLSNRVFDKVVFSKVKERFGGRLKYAFSGGAALAPDVARFIDQLNILVFEGYGLSETSPVISANYPGHRKIGSVGRPIPGVRVRIDTEAGTGSVPGEGEIINYGPNTMLGYYHLPEETQETLLPDGGLRTGDLGYLDSDGYLFVTGRVKDLYKLQNGKYVAPAPLEEELQLSPYIAQAMLYGANLVQNIALLVPDEAGLRHYCERHGLPAGSLKSMLGNPRIATLLEDEVARLAADWKSYERPARVIAVSEEWTVENNLITPTLKIKRRKLVDKYKVLLEGGAEAPLAPIDRVQTEKGAETGHP